MFFSDDMINRDGILYVNMAQAYIDGGLFGTIQHSNFGWPFFSILIAYTHQLTSLSIEHSAFLLNGVLFALFIDTLINISNKILPNTRQLVFAAVLIICFGTLNEYRDFIIRDIGYWAFCSLTLYRFMLFLEKSTLRNATLWQIMAVIAVLFRIEGVVILLGLPLYLFATHPPKQAIKQNFQLNYLLIIGIIFTSVISMSSLGPADAFGKLESISFYLNIETYLTTFNHNIEVMETQILNQFSEDYSGFILISGLLMMLAYKLMKGLTLIHLGLYAASWKLPPLQNTPYSRLLLYFTIINILVISIFLLARYFISTRYCMMALASLLLLMLPRLCAVIDSLWLKRQKLLLSLVALILFIGLIDSVTSSRSKSYIKNTSIWASKNLPENSTILTDNQFIEYYVKSHHKMAAISRDEITMYPQYDYLIVIEKRKQQALKEMLATMNIESIFSLSSKRGDKATVYKIVTINSN